MDRLSARKSNKDKDERKTKVTLFGFVKRMNKYEDVFIDYFSKAHRKKT